MTDLVSLLFIAMILFDCKITNFSLHLYVYVFGQVSNQVINLVTKESYAFTISPGNVQLPVYSAELKRGNVITSKPNNVTEQHLVYALVDRQFLQ